MNSKQRRKLIRKHIKSITLIRVQSRLIGGDGYEGRDNYYMARDFDRSTNAYAFYQWAIRGRMEDVQEQMQ